MAEINNIDIEMKAEEDMVVEPLVEEEEDMQVEEGIVQDEELVDVEHVEEQPAKRRRRRKSVNPRKVRDYSINPLSEAQVQNNNNWSRNAKIASKRYHETEKAKGLSWPQVVADTLANPEL